VIEEILAQCTVTGNTPEPSVALPAINSATFPQRLSAPVSEPEKIWESSLSYDDWCRSVFRQPVSVPGVRICASWAEDSEWGLRAYNALALLECEYAARLLAEIRDKNISGDIVEFGIFEGWWLNFLHQTTESLGLHRRIYGFDSFEGLSDPHPDHDQAFWKKGQYACSLEQVSRNVQAAARPRLRLVKGFFEKSLRSPEAFEFLFYGAIGHFYTRVHHKK
jgi:hypothetical protein